MHHSSELKVQRDFGQTPIPAPASAPHPVALRVAAFFGAIMAGGAELTVRQAAVLGFVVAEPNRLSVRDLAPRLGKTPPVVTRALDRLEQLGLVERRPCPTDLRLIRVMPSQAGIEWIRAVAKAMKA